MRQKAVLLFKLVILFAFLLLASCNLRRPVTGTATYATAERTLAPGEVAFSLEAGTRVRWVDGSYVVFVPAGEFLMGNDKPTGSDHAPAHTVDLSGFWIHQTEVTNQMYAACVDAGICSPPYQNDKGPYFSSRYSNHPVVNVDWNQAETYCEWILGRLPTEAEWEKAARGDEGKLYPWGDEAPTCSLLNAGDCIDPADTSPVRDYLPGASPYDLADMAGNAFEWVHDWYGEDYYAGSLAENPTGPSNGEERVFRGSSYQTPIDELQIFLRNYLDPQENQNDLGFRCILTGETVANPPPPLCEVAAYEPLPEDGPTSVPPTYSLNPYCQPFGDGFIIRINIPMGHAINPDDFTVTSPLGDIFCFVDPAFPTILTCDGPGLPEGATEDVTICTASGVVPPDVEPTCPAGYYWNALAYRCRSTMLPPIEAECGPGYYQTDAYGCIPLATGPLDDECPVGFGLGMTFSGTDTIFVCVPTDGDAYCEDNPYCSRNQTCVVGTYNPEEFCCEAPEDLLPTCEVGYHYDMFAGLCRWEGEPLDNCVTQPVTLPNCETITEPPPEQVSCSSITDPIACNNDTRCRWHQPITVPGPGHCEDR